MDNSADNVRSQMRKGVLEYCILSILEKKEAYASSILEGQPQCWLRLLVEPWSTFWAVF